MSVDQVTPPKPPRQPNDVKFVRYDDYIESKIQSTRRAVKLVDLTSSLVALGSGVLAYLLVVAVADHWIVPGGFNIGARIVLFAALILSIGHFAVRRLVPLVVRSINPVYAAHAIEEGSPSLKNSLINLLLFRQRRADIPDAVYRTLEEQAAQRLTRVPVDTAVDRSMLIRLGYLLIAVVAVAGLYKVFSPKDPIVAARRVLMPWADIMPASRVAISSVKPGSVTVSRGEFVDVSAEVRGIGDDDTVLLRYTTDDGQVVGKPIPMKPAGDGMSFLCRVADESDGAQQVGLTRNLTYRLEAGDARSLDYAVTVVEAPSMLVERVDYDYPAYTELVDRTVKELGDIKAIEGTRVTVHSRANGPIRQADVDFDADGRQDLRMTSKGPGANASFDLALRDDRQTPRHASYVLRFTNEEGRSNRDPVKHSINVERDDDPEASILAPKEKSIDVRLNETVTIDVDAIDPDFKLSAVRLRADSGGLLVLNEPLLKSVHRGRFTARFAFTPNAHRLKAGDVVDYWVEAVDNRTPKANQTASQHQQMRVVSPDLAKQPPPDRIARNDRQQPKPGEQQKDNQQNQKDQNEKDQGGAGQQDGKAEKQEGGKQGGQQKSSDKQQPQHGEKQQGGGANNSADGSKDQQPPNGESQPGAGKSAKNAQGAEKNNNESKPGEKGQPGQQSKSDQKSSDGQKSSDEQTGAGASGGQQSKDAAQPAGARPDQQEQREGEKKSAREGEKGRAGEGEKSDSRRKPGNEQNPVSSEGDNDGEAFERIQQHMERSGDLKKEENASADAERKEGEKGRAGEGEKSQQDDAKSGKTGESGSSDGKKENQPGDANEKQTSNQQSKEGADQQNAKSRDGEQQQKQPAGEQGKQEKSPNGQETKSKGPAGAGEEQKSDGTPNSPNEMKPTEKREQTGSKDESNKQEPPAGSHGKRESDSQGDQGGDKSGGGEEGAGQKAPREGTGSDGQNQSADEGAGESAEKGKGNASPNAGQDAKSDQKTGSSGSEKGEDSKQQDGKGDKAGGKPSGQDTPTRRQQDQASKDGGSKDGASNEKQSQPNEQQGKAEKSSDKQGAKDNSKQDSQQGSQQGSDPGKKDEGANKDTPGGSPGGNDGQPGTAGNPQPSTVGSAPAGDEANLEYARKQTDLVLEKLSDQMKKGKVDDRLLKELGWSRDDLKRFVDRWKERKAAAEREDPSGDAAKRELDDALRSLGLRKGALQQSALKKDSMRDLKEGYRGPVPLEYQERLRAYNQGVSRARPDGE